MAARPPRRLLLLFLIAAAVRARTRTAVGYSQSISSSRTLLATVLSSGKNTTTDSMRACMNCQKFRSVILMVVNSLPSNTRQKRGAARLSCSAACLSCCMIR